MTFNMRAIPDPAETDPSVPRSAHEGGSLDDAGGARGARGGAAAHAMSSASPSPASPDAPRLRRLEAIFHACFEDEYATTLEGGGDEPLYIASPDPGSAPHRIVYREDYFASALHEIAHWFLAGASRRALDDYGYWYHPDGRSPDQQLAFEQVEARPQALEWILSEACGHAFHLSADNLEGGAGPSARFAAAVEREKSRLEHDGLPPRAARFVRALRAAWSVGDDVDRG